MSLARDDRGMNDFSAAAFPYFDRKCDPSSAFLTEQFPLSQLSFTANVIFLPGSSVDIFVPI